MAANAVTKTVSAPFIAFENTLKSWLMWLGLAFIVVIALIIAIKLL